MNASFQHTTRETMLRL